MYGHVFVPILNDEVAFSTSRLSSSPKSAFYSFMVSQVTGYVGNITEYMGKFNLVDSRLYYF